MPDYGWKGKTKDGLSKGLRAIAGDEQPEKIDVPKSAAVGVGATRIVCGVEECGRLFKARVAFVNHFRAKHPEHNTEKDSWREFVTDA